MITFVTLFLGLFLGVQPVEVRVDPRVAEVELVLDGAPEGRLTGPGWRGTIDFGQQLEPHRLEAVALDRDGRELERAVRWVNLPRPPAEADLFLERTADGGRAVRLVWGNVLGTRPHAVRFELDGRPLPQADLSGAVLPALDERTVHFVRAELDFPDNVSTSAELVFGGGFQDAVDTELTAVALEVEGRHKLSAEALEGRLSAGGEPLQVVAVEEGGIDLVLVPDAGAMSVLRHMALGLERQRSAHVAIGTALEHLEEGLRHTLPLPREMRLRVLWPFPQVRPGESGVPFNLFVTTPELTHTDGGLLWLLSRVQPPAGLDPTPRLATAVAVASTVGAARNRRRAVVVLWTGDGGDRSEVGAVEVRRYLERLRVPLYTWSLVEETEAPGWGESVDASNELRLERAFRRLCRDLDRQRIAWVSGTWLPQTIELRAGPSTGGGDLRLARTPVPGTEPEVPPTALLASRPSREPALPEPATVGDLISGAEAGGSPSIYGVGGAQTRVAVDEGVRLRTAPDTGASHLSVVDAPTELPVLERRGPWVRITYSGRSGWVRLSADGAAHPDGTLLPVAELPPSPDGVVPAPQGTGFAAGSEEASRADRRARAERVLGPSETKLGPFDLLTDVEDPSLLARIEPLAGSVTAVFEQRFGVAVSAPRPGEAVLLFARESDYRSFAAQEDDPWAEQGLAGHSGGGLAVLFVGDRKAGEVASLLVHELTHLIAHRTLRAELPPWLDEGMAEDLGSSRIDPQGGIEPGTVSGGVTTRDTRQPIGEGRVRVERRTEISGGRAALLRLAQAADRGDLPSLEHLVSLSHEGFLTSPERALEYPLSGFFVRFLLDRRASAEAFRGFLAQVAKGGPADADALAAALDIDWGRLQRAFEAWLRVEVARLGPG